MKTRLKEPCKDCPFKRRSIPGWLGPWTPEEVIAQVRHTTFPCHKTIREGDNEDQLESCAGAALWLNNTISLSRNRDVATHQKKLKEEGGVELAQRVFANAKGFCTYHGENAEAKIKKFFAQWTKY